MRTSATQRPLRCPAVSPLRATIREARSSNSQRDRAIRAPRTVRDLLGAQAVADVREDVVGLMADDADDNDDDDGDEDQDQAVLDQPLSSFAITITAATADFTLSLSPTSASVAHGSTVGSMLTITGGANQSFTLTCTGAPANSNCSAGSMLTLANGNSSATVAVVFNAFVTTTSSLDRATNIEAAVVLPFGLLGSIALFAFGRRRSRSWSLLLVAVIGVGLLAITGCGGGGNKSTTTDPAAGTYPLTITVTSGAISHTATFTVTVQ